MKEEWKDVEGYEGFYQVSNMGRVRSLMRGIVLRQQNRSGYPSVSLRGCRKNIHRLVAEHFIPNAGNHPLVLHRDDNKKNYTISNLYWGDYRQNMKDRSKNSQSITDKDIKWIKRQMYLGCSKQTIIRNSKFSQYTLDRLDTDYADIEPSVKVEREYPDISEKLRGHRKLNENDRRLIRLWFGMGVRRMTLKRLFNCTYSTVHGIVSEVPHF